MPDALITLNQELDGKYMANVLCFSNIVEEETVLQEIADSLRASFAIWTDDSLTELWSLLNITVGFIEGSEITHSIDVPFSNGVLVGGQLTDMLPSQSALLVSTSFIGVKPNRGRIYLGGYTESATEDNTWVAGVIGDAAGMVNGWVDGIGQAPNQAFLRICGRPNANRPDYISSPVSLVIPRGRIKTIRNRAR